MLAALERGKTLDEARDRLGDLSTADRAFASAMVMTALRRRGHIEAALAPHLKNPCQRARICARFCTLAPRKFYSWMSHRMPQLTKPWRPRGGASSPFAGLLMRCYAVSARLGQIWTSAGPADMVAGGLARGLRRRADSGDGKRFAPNATTGFTVSRLNALKDWLAANPGMGHVLTPTCLRLEASGDVTRLPGFDAGMWWVQDISAALAAPLLRPEAQADILDLCAAPGGKPCSWPHTARK